MIIFTEKFKVRIMEKIVMAVRLTPKTRDKLEALKKETGLPFGVIIDMLVANAKIDTYVDKPFN